MEIKKIEDSRVDEIVKKSEAQHTVSAAATPQQSSGQAKKIFPQIKIGIKLTKELGNLIAILILLALALIQSIELINLRQQIKSGQFGGSSGNTQGLPGQQGGC